LQVPNPATASQLGRSLAEAGLWIGAIRPPTVPTSRLRLTLMATHQPEHLAQLMAALRSAIPLGA
jgi:8-amino-7-oxononanoate synthase